MKLSLPVIHRLPRYLRYVNSLHREGIKKVSSRELAQMLGTTASQVRQDFNTFGGIGRQGIGYSVDSLKTELQGQLYGDKPLTCILLGTGSLGSAIARYLTDVVVGYQLAAVFDTSPSKVGKSLCGIVCYDTAKLAEYCNAHHVDVAVMCVPTAAAEQLTPQLIDVGVTNFWNFSHYNIAANYPDVIVEDVYIRDSLEALSYRIIHDESD